MKLGVFTALFSERNFEEVLGYVKKTGFEAVELYSGALAPNSHCNPDILLNSDIKLQEFKDALARHELFLSILNCSGNPVSPVPGAAKRHQDAFEKTLRLAEKLGVHSVVVFSGCPGGGPKDETPNWVTCPWPDEYLSIYEYQWNEVLIPYWESASRLAAEYGVEKLAFEMHPGFCVYNPESLLKLRSAVGPSIGANFDPSHLFWQGIDVPGAILRLGEAIFHFHAKDTRVFEKNIARNGNLDPKHYAQIEDRAWLFSTVGYGQPDATWKQIINALAIIGYDYVISVEHEDALMCREEGLQKAYDYLRGLIIADPPEKMWWA